MKRHSWMVLSACALVGAQAQPAPGGLASLAWLSGCWRADGGEEGSVEHWLPLAGGTLLGVGRTVKGGKTVGYEFMQIRTDAQDKVVFIALPSGKSPETFPVLTLADGAVVFENLAHEFPQRVMYRPAGPDRLAARIEGVRGGVVRGIDFPMTRTSCERKS